MDHAWLDSLSEDWESQPRSSGSPTPSLPSLPSLSNSTSDASRGKSSRIPKFDPQNQVWAPPQDGNISPLSERSLNEHNIPLSLRSVRQPSKLRDEITQDLRGRRLSRTLSESTTHSTLYHTVQHKSASLSPKKGTQETPEWKRRLLQGEVAYGEQRDLFSPAGLESIFNPPPPQEKDSRKATTQIFEEQSILPSSPPPYNRDRIAEQLNVESQNAENEVLSRKQPRAMNYNMVDEGISDFSADDISRSSSFQPTKAASQSSRNVSNSVSVPRSATTQKPTSEELRAVSGQSDIRHEEFSPVYVARHNTVEGKIDYAALDLPPRELQSRLEQIREVSPPNSGFNEDDYSEAFVATDTEDLATNAQFVNLRRGGYSQEGSFQKRMLSPSSLPAIDESDMLPEESMQASTPKEFPNVRKTRVSHESIPSRGTEVAAVDPQTPHGSPSKSGEKSSSGSPLKLFGNYDTFTNQKLLRRLSQFEGHYEQSETDRRPSSQSTHPELTEKNAASSNSQKVSQQSKARGDSRKVNSFGEGDLDSFQFSEPSYNTYASNSEDEDKEIKSMPTLDPSTQSKFRFQLDPSPAIDGSKIIRKSQKYVAVTTSTTKHLISTRKSARPGTGSSLVSSEIISTQVVENLQTPRKRIGDSEGKRLPKSPLKDPTPKRRRTFQQSEIASPKFEDESYQLDSVNETHQQIQSMLGRKRKDARHGDDQQPADPKVLALRQILRPRTPTPSQRGSLHDRTSSQELDFDTLENAKSAQARKIAKIQAELDATNPLRGSMPLGVSQHMLNESRKGSVTTQDFLDEAKKIMAGIRGKARSGLTSLEESESENDRIISPLNETLEHEQEDSYEESTREPFSRPPSREGKPVERLQIQQADPALLDHLRKYQEKSDMDLVIASSIRSIAAAKEASEAAKELDRMTDETISRSSGRFITYGDHIESDPPNTRLSENPDVQRKRKHSTSSAVPGSEDHPEIEFPSHGSSASSNQSTTQSIPTGSSRGSDSRRVIAPHTVSHLIPEQLAGMYLDKDRNIWVKRKSVDTKNGGMNFLPSDETEDDPFGDIPDLSVDETQEFQRIKAVAARKKEALVAQQQSQQGYQAAMRLISQQGPEPLERVEVGLPLSNGAPLMIDHKPLLKSLSNQPVLANPDGARRSSPENEANGHHREKLAGNIGQGSSEDEAEKEISILEDRVDFVSPQRRRNVTITFSSPLEQVLQPSGQDESGSERDEAQSSTLKKRNSAGGSILINKKSNVSKSSTVKIRSALRNTSRRMSLGGHTFSCRPVSRIDEHDEESFGKHEDDRRRRSISVVVTTPLPARRETSVVLATPRQMDQIGNLSLTPLSEFTMRQSDESFGLDVSYVDGGQRYMLGPNSKRTLSLSIKELVEKITQVEPYEPFWEHLKQLDLKDKRLTTLHKLDEFCEHLEELDASHNQVTQLDGVPVSVRDLRMTHNSLSDLAAWGHLSNLQYIDISNNQIESLSGFRSLVHLRGLRADNNQIKSLDGISHLNGLLQLRLRGNAIESLDFAGSRLLRLTDLDLKDNHIYQITNLHELQSLSSLNVEDNNLGEFSMDGPSPLRALRYLKLSGNQLEKLDVSRFPDLRLLYVDRNRLETVSGLLKTKHLDSLSMREQQDGVLIDTSFLSQALEVRKLFLSGNLLTTFQPKVDYLNLQYLEMANCGLETLSPEFGCMVANTRVLNLNFNALRDVKPLVGILRLKKLHLAGNRLSRLRTTTCLLSQFPTLSFADLRNNPLTQGFYPPISDTRLVLHKAVEEEVAGQSFTLGDANRTHDSKYASRLDQHTKMMRRVFEILILSGCKHLKTLDGLEVDRSVLVSRDLIWRSLVDAGVMKEEEGDALDSEPQNKENSPEETGKEDEVEKSLVSSERWQAEDSFA